MYSFFFFFQPWHVQHISSGGGGQSLFWKKGIEVKRGGELCSLIPSSMQSVELLPTSRALKVKCKNGRSQRPKKNDILLVTTPSARDFVVGASAFNWKQVQCFCALTHIRFHTNTFKLSIISPFPELWWQLVKPDAQSNAWLSAGRLSSAVSEDTGCPGEDVLLQLAGGNSGSDCRYRTWCWRRGVYIFHEDMNLSSWLSSHFGLFLKIILQLEIWMYLLVSVLVYSKHFPIFVLEEIGHIFFKRQHSSEVVEPFPLS